MSRFVIEDEGPRFVLEEDSATKRGRDFAQSSPLKAGLAGLANVMQGPTLGFSDEVVGLVGGLRSFLGGQGFKQGYRDTRDMTRGAIEQARKDTDAVIPMASAVTQAMAAAPLMVLNPGASLAAPTLAGRTGLAAAQGGMFGAATGAGESTADSVSGVGLDALKSGTLGAVTGGLVTPVMAGVGAVSRNAGARAAPAVAAAAERVGLGGIANSLNQYSRNYGNEKVAEALLRDSLDGAAPRSVVAQGVRDLRSYGPEARLVDAGKDNTNALLDTLTMLPGKTKTAVSDAIRNRQAGRADRLIGSAEDAFGTGGNRLVPQLDEWVTQRSKDAAPLYGEVYKQGTFIEGRLAEIVDAAKQLGASGQAKKIATAEMRPFGLDSGAKFAGMRELDYLKQGLDDMIQANKNANNGKLDKLGVSVNNLRLELLDILDKQTNGAYKAARDVYAGPSALIDAANEGKKFLQQDALKVSSDVARLSASEQEAFRLGVFETLRGKLAAPSGQTEVMGMWKNKGLREKLQAVFPDEASFAKFVKSSDAELKMKELERVGRGSQTAARQFGAGDLDVSALGDASTLLGSATHGNVPGLMMGAASLWNRVKTPEPVRDQMGQLLLSQGRSGQRGLLNLADTLEEVNAARLRNAGLLGSYSGYFGGGLLQ